MAIPAELALEFLPEVEQVVERATEEAKSFAYELARQAGLTEEDNYRGWIPVFILLYRFVWPPVKTALQIELQIAGVLDQLYNWLGGATSATEQGLGALAKSSQTVAAAVDSGIVTGAEDVYKFFSGL